MGDGQWRHVGVTFGPMGSELYLDGVSQGTAVGAVPEPGSAALLLIGLLGLMGRRGCP